MQGTQPATAPEPFAPFNQDELSRFGTVAANMPRIGSAVATVVELSAERREKRARYEADLASFDWFHQFSDDSRSVRDGIAGLASLHAQQAEVDPDGAIWSAFVEGRGLKNVAMPRIGYVA